MLNNQRVQIRGDSERAIETAFCRGCEERNVFRRACGLVDGGICQY